MEKGLNEALALYRASVRKSPALMMETVNVDSNRGVTSRGNSPYDKFSSPETRSKVLESRMQEIAAFAQSRSIPVSNLYALAEAAMRTGKIPDMGQFGLAGDDAVATKQFLISNVLNIAGLEWTDYKGDPVEETAPPAEPVRDERSERVASVLKDSGLDPRAFMAESSQVVDEGSMGAKRLQRRGEYVKGSEGVISHGWPKTAKANWKNISSTAREMGHPLPTERKEPRQPKKPPAPQKPPVQQQSVDFDPSQYMSEGSGGRKALDRRLDATKKAHDKKFERLNKAAPAETTYDDLRKQTADTRGQEDEARQRVKQRLAQRPVGPKERLADMAKHNQKVSRGREKTVGSGAPGWGAYNQEVGRAVDKVKVMRPGSRFHGNKAVRVPRAADKLKQVQQNQSVDFDPSLYMAEEGGPYGTGGAPESANSSPAKTSSGGDPNPQNYERRDLLPKKVMAELRKIAGDGVYGYPREELFRLARERGLLGTEEDVQVEHDYAGHAQKHGGKFVKYIQGNIGIYQFPTNESANEFAGHCADKTTATPKVDGKMVFIDEPVLGEADGIVATSTDSSAGSQFAPNPTQYDVEDELLKGRKKVKEDKRSDSDKILGIMDGDPRGDSWPKLGSTMASLLNMENMGIQRAPRGFHQDEPAPEQIEEMSTAAGMGGFIGGGMMGGMTGRTCAMPSYDASYELPDDPEKRVEMLKKMLSKHGLKKVQESDETVVREPFGEQHEAAPNSTEVPVVRDERYDSHPSRFMAEGISKTRRQIKALRDKGEAGSPRERALALKRTIQSGRGAAKMTGEGSTIQSVPSKTLKSGRPRALPFRRSSGDVGGLARRTDTPIARISSQGEVTSMPAHRAAVKRAAMFMKKD